MTMRIAAPRRGAGYGVLAPLVVGLGLVVVACSPAGSGTGPDDVAVTSVAGLGTARPATVTAYPDPLTDEQVLATVTAMDAALQAGDVEAFVDHVGPELAEQQRAWFEAVRNVPMDVRQLRPDRVVSRASPTGTILHVALRHQVSGADRVPVLQQYRWVLAPDDEGRVRLVEARGRNGLFNGHPQLWDLGPVAVLEADDVILLAPEWAREDAEELLPGLSEAAQAIRADFPSLGRHREVLTVQLVEPADVADMLDSPVDEFVNGASWMRTSTDDPGLGRLGLPPAEDTLDHRLLLDVDVAVEDLAVFGPGPGGNTYLRNSGAHAAVVGGREQHEPVGWLMAGVPTWYELSGDPSLEDALLLVAADAHLGGPPEALPAPFWDTEDEYGYHVASVSLLRHLEETFGREETLGVVEELFEVDAWYDEDTVWPTVAEALGTGEEQLLAGWLRWGEELLARVEPLGTDVQQG